MGSISNFFSSNGGMHQVLQNGNLVTDLTTGKTGFVISDSNGFSMVSGQDGQVHNIIKNGSMSTDLTTGKTYFEV